MRESSAGKLVFCRNQARYCWQKNGVYWLRSNGSGKLLTDSATWWEDNVAEPSKAIGNSLGALFFAGQMQNFKRPYIVIAGSFVPNGQLNRTRMMSDENAWQSAEDLALLPDGNIALLCYCSVRGKNSEEGACSGTIRIVPGDGGKGQPVNYWQQTRKEALPAILE
jgi:hypothetical protein